MPVGSKIFLPCRSLGNVSNHIPLQVRYIRSRKENLIVTCVGRSFHTYGISHFGLLSVSGLHPSDITSMTVDTFHVYTACENTVYAWRRGTELKHEYRGHKHPIHLMIPFGAHLISVDVKSNVIVWDIKQESVYLQLSFSNKSFKITALLHPSTYINKILLGSDQGEMQLWNINTSKLIYTFKGWDSSVTCLEQAPALDVVAVGLANGWIILHNLIYDETVMEFTQDWGTVTSISFRTDGSPIMATGAASGHIVFWNLEERRVATQLLSAHDGPVTGMVCLSNEPLVVTSSPDNSVKLWIFDMSDGGARLLRIREGHSAPPSYIRFHGANGDNILSAAPDSTLRIFNTKTEQFNKSMGKASYNRKASKKKKRAVEDPLIMPPIVQFSSEITREKEWDNIACVHSGIPTVTTWSYDKIRMGEGKLLPERFNKIKQGTDVVATCVCITHCGNFVIIGYNTGHIDRFNMQSGKWRDSYGEPSAHSAAVRGVAVDSLNQLIISGGGDYKIKFWRFKSKGGDPLTTLDLDEPISFFRSHPESAMIALAMEDFSVLVLDSETRRVVRKFAGHATQLTDATFSPDSRWLITSSMDCSIRIWDVPSGQLVDQFATEAPCVSLDMSPTGELLSTAHVDHLGIFLWTNKTLFSRITLKAISLDEEPQLLESPVICGDIEEDLPEPEEGHEFLSPEQISSELVTLSTLPASRWLNLLDIDLIKMRNKPKEPPKKPKSAPFFLPTIASLNFTFDIKPQDTSEEDSKLLLPSELINLSEFGKLLSKTLETNNFREVIEKIKTYGPSMIDFEIKSLAPEGGGSHLVMLQFMKCIEFMLNSNKDFELAEAYLSVFLKSHGTLIAEVESLRHYLVNIQSCHNVTWNRLQDKFYYSLNITHNLKTM